MAISPTLKNRIESLDVLRGAAILGILLANIFAFAWPSLGESIGKGVPIPGMNDWVEGMRVAFVTGKFRGLFCLLFGAGLYLQYTKLAARGQWPGVYLKRTGVLMGIGLIHALLIWYGDILFLYSLTAFLAFMLVKLDDRAILITAVGCLSFTFFCGSAVFGAMAFVGDEIAGLPGLESLMPSTEIATYQNGTYLEQVVHRATYLGQNLSSFFVFIPEVLGLFLIGIYMMRSGILVKPSAHRERVKALAWVGGTGLMLNLLIGVSIGFTGNQELKFLAEMGLNAPLAIGYALLGAVLVERNPGGIFSKLLAPVGKVALTSYLLTSVLCTVIFYSWGGGLFGKLNYWGMMGVVLGVWVVLIGVAHFITRRYSMGPVEYVWRRMTLGDFGSRQVQPETRPETLGLPPRME